MPSTQKLPSGKYRGYYRDANGKQRYTPAAELKGDARNAAIDAQAKSRRKAALNTGELSASITWGKWWDTIVDKRQFDSDTALAEESIVRLHIRPRWDKEPLNKITRPAVQDWIDTMKLGKKPGFALRIWSVFSWSITVAMDGEVLTASPIAGVKLPKRVKEPRPWISTDERDVIVGYLAQEVADAVTFSLETGLRPAELCALHAHRIDFDGGWMTVAESYIHHRKQIRGWPKNSKTRTIPLSDKALEIAKRRLDGRDLAAPCGVPHIDGKCRHPLVFLSPRGKVLNRDLLSTHLHRAAEAAAKDPKRTTATAPDPKSSYSLRHGFGTRLGAAGYSVFDLQELMGHSDPRITAGYVQKAPDARDRMMTALGRSERSGAKGAKGKGVKRKSAQVKRTPTPKDSGAPQ